MCDCDCPACQKCTDVGDVFDEPFDEEEEDDAGDD